ncbi:hypothetical protein VE00_07064 [Pseudogymnoascus sp. WSF 3629]|nr:hypothetical protein VE00_07064 [Pseudogymnoascus sp. WSF 3629]
MDTDKDDFRFDISIDHMLPVQKLHEFQNQKYSFAVVEMTIKLEDIGMSKMTLDFNFPLNLLLNTIRLDFILVHNLKSADEPTATFPCEIHPPKLSFT